MSDIVSELLDRAYSHKPNDFLCERAAMEIERLRTLAEQATPSKCSVHPRLTEEEREAIERAAFCLNGGEDWSPDVGTKDKQACVTLRKLLARLS